MTPPAPEYRRCPATGRWVILAPERALRPIELPHGEPHPRDAIPFGECPFCPGREHDTPGEVYAVRDPGTAPNGPGWRLRVVPNRFPAVRPLPDDPRTAASDGFFESAVGYGVHEVVILTDAHEADPTRLSDEQARYGLIAYRERIRTLAKNQHLAYATVFQNVGAEAGASLAHAHAQVVATPVVPDAIRGELEVAGDYHERIRRCVYCDLIRHERELGVRVVADTGRFVVVCPFAPRFAYEMWVLPTGHDSRYEAATDADLAELAGLLKRVLAALDAVLPNPAYNVMLHTGPLRAADLPYYHWHVEVASRTARAAGFELGGGCYINAVMPERTTTEMKTALDRQQSQLTAN
jgi:UDPglucose--hexose-1-phosphate uridylyltransferase